MNAWIRRRPLRLAGKRLTGKRLAGKRLAGKRLAGKRPAVVNSLRIRKRICT